MHLLQVHSFLLMHSPVRSFSLMISAVVLLHAAFFYPILSWIWIALLLASLFLFMMYMILIYRRYFSLPLEWKPITSLYKVIFIQVLPQFLFSNMLSVNIILFSLTPEDPFIPYLLSGLILSFGYCLIVSKCFIVFKSDRKTRLVNMFVDGDIDGGFN